MYKIILLNSHSLAFCNVLLIGDIGRCFFLFFRIANVSPVLWLFFRCVKVGNPKLKRLEKATKLSLRKNVQTCDSDKLVRLVFLEFFSCSKESGDC